MKDRIAVVTPDDKFIRWEDRRVVHRDQLVHRSVHVLLYDGQGRLVIQRRHRQKLTYPGVWDMSSSGHVEEGDYPDANRPDEALPAVYAAVAARELEEELGVRAPLSFVGHFTPEPGVHYEQIGLFRGMSDGPFRFQAEEIEEIDQIAVDQLKKRIAERPQEYTRTLRWFLDRV
jgi:16S rRNA (adenine1518-N6/adenine1519-N6)-dimethyltransferase